MVTDESIRLMNQSVVWLALATTLIPLIWSTWRARRQIAAHLRGEMTINLIIIVSFAVLFIGSGLLMTPAFVHSHLYGVELHNDMLRFPAAPHFRAEYGSAGFMLLGGLMKVFGPTFETTARINAFLLLSSFVFMGLFVRLWTNQRLAPLFTLLVGGTTALFMRIGYSEDAHVAALFWGGAGLALTMAGLRFKATGLMIAATGALFLALYSRQDFFPWLTAAPLLLLIPEHRDFGQTLLKDRRTWLWGLLVTGLSVPFVWTSLAAGAHSLGLVFALHFLTNTEFLTGFLARSPLWDGFSLSVILLPLAVYGAVRRPKLLLIFSLALPAFALLSFVNWHASSWGDLYGFTAPLASVLLILACVGWFELVRRTRLIGHLVFIITVVTGLAGTISVAQVTNPLYDEYRFVNKTLLELPEGSAVIYVSDQKNQVLSFLPWEAVQTRKIKPVPVRLSGPVEVPPDTKHVYFFQGLACHVFSGDLLLAQRGVADLRVWVLGATGSEYEGVDMLKLWGLHEGAPFALEPGVLNPGCVQLRERTLRPIKETIITDVADDPPFLFFPDKKLPVGFYEWTTTTSGPGGAPGR
jgi:hypothetical protein